VKERPIAKRELAQEFLADTDDDEPGEAAN
jgi:hypothetical protein